MASYYVDATLGDDSNPGTQTQPWKTVSKVNSASLSPGDNVYFKRGETWVNEEFWPQSGESGSPVTYGAYGSGDKPIITGVTDIPGWDNPDNWTDNGGNVWYISLDNDPQRLWLDDVEYLRAGSVADINSSERHYYESGNLYVYSTQNPANEYNSMKGCSTSIYYLVLANTKSYFNFENLSIEGGRGACIALYRCDNVNITSCDIGKNSCRAFLLYGDGTTATMNVTIANCVIDSNWHFSYDAPSDRGVGDGITLSGDAQNCIIRNNTIKDWGHAGIELCASSTDDSGVNNNKIYGNTITGENISYMHGIVTDGVEGKCQNNEIYCNRIKNVNNNQLNGNNNWFHHNIVDTMWNTPCKSFGTGIAIDLSTYNTDFVCHDNKYDNNTIVNCDEKGIKLAAVYDDVKNNYFRNNILYNCGTDSKEGLNDISIWIKDQSEIHDNTFQNNCIYNSGVDDVISYRGTSMTVAEFNSQSGTNGDTISNNVQLDPLFVDADYYDFHLQPTSPCIDAGVSVGLTEDYEGNSVPWGEGIDIGAYERTAGRIKDYLDFSIPDYNYYLPVEPQKVMVERGEPWQEVLLGSGFDEKRIDLGDVKFYVTLKWPTLTKSESNDLFSFYLAVEKSKTFRWQNPKDGYDYVVRFDTEMKRAILAGGLYSIEPVRLKVLKAIVTKGFGHGKFGQGKFGQG